MSAALHRFRPEMYAFLSDLAANNEREWFHANKARYEAAVREPALEFIQVFGERLDTFAPHFEANARAQGGSLFKIHRDVRFSKDKTPYKINTGLHFRHEQARNAHAPGFYLHVQPRSSFMGAGLWRPESKVAYRIREHIAENRDEWQSIRDASALRERFTLDGERLVRPPKGFDKDDPLIEDLKLKDFILRTSLKQSEVTHRDFIDQFEALCRATAPFVAFVCNAVGVAY